MSQAAIPAAVTGNPASRSVTESVPDKSRWRWAGSFGLAHIIVTLGAFSLEGVASVEHGSPAAKVLQSYQSVSTDRVVLSSYVEAMAFVLLVPALILFSRLLGRRTETGKVAAQAVLGLGLAYVASTLAVGFPPLTASIFAAHHGVDAGTVATVNDLRNYGFVLQVALLAAFTLALGIAAVAERRFRAWGAVGIGLGAVGLVATPFAPNVVSMAWMIWWVILCAVSLKGGPNKVADESKA